MTTARTSRSSLALRRLLVGFVLQVTIVGTHTANAHSTISTTGTSAGKKSTTLSGPNPASTDGLVALMDANYLDSVNSAASQPNDAYAYDVQSIEEISDNSLTSFRSGLAKSRKQAENQMKALDWWSRLANKNAKSRPHQAAKDSARSRPATTPPTVYREQPISQNSILTIRNQLQAIRDKHHLLVTKSVTQLKQLDQKLIDSYKLCLKKKMPLYAGMLYRTRDFVVRMANEVKQERQLLAAVTKQAQRVLRHKLDNRTLVKEYNRLALTTNNLSTAEPSRLIDLPHAASQDDAIDDNAGKSKRSADVLPALATSLTRVVSSSTVTGSAQSATNSQHAGKGADPRWISDEVSGQEALLTSTDNQHTPSNILKSSSSADKIARHNAATLVPARHQQSVGAKKMLSNGNNLLLTRRQATVEPIQVLSENAGSDNQQLERFESELVNALDDSVPTTSTSKTYSSSATRKPKQQGYTVNINEVNLKRELLKTQALIDRINASSVELMGVVDDIVYLFKLTAGDYNTKKGLATSGKTIKYEKIHGGPMLMDMVNGGMDPKRAKKVIKSPFKVLLERYNKLTSQTPANLITAATGTTIGKVTTPAAGATSTRYASYSDNIRAGDNSIEAEENNLPELKPLFDSRSANLEMDVVDLDLGFDAPAVIET